MEAPTHETFKRTGIAVALCAAIALTACQSSNHEGKFAATPTWEQDFTQTKNLDTTALKPNTDPDIPTYNDEAQGYTSRSENARVEDGSLVIEARKEPYTYPTKNSKTYSWTSARLESYDSRNGKDLPNGLTFEYGKIEATIKAPDTRGAWPAFWLLSANEPNSSKADVVPGREDDHYKKDGEIDVEWYGNHPNQVEATVFNYNGPKDGISQTTRLTSIATSYHKYGVEVTPDHVRWTLDNKPYAQFDKKSNNPDDWPFGNGNRLYFILNVAMGGTGGGDIDPETVDQRMLVKDVSFWKYE